jgi:lipoprotein NlpD
MQDDVPQPLPVVTPTKPKPGGMAKDEGEDEALEWGMPTSGKVIAEFSENANRKGVDIVGSRGQSIVASAAGKVVYSGSGLRGYGKLIIIKHNKTFLSAYAHNDQILVKEGQNVSKGQKIAEMGSSDADQVGLHFEIRKFGKPVDPAKYLPLVKS